METVADKAQEIGNQLIAVCRDAQQGFETAADAVHGPELRGELIRFSRQRGDFVADLVRHLQDQGCDPVAYGSIPGVLRRGWMNLTAVLGNNTHAILNACEQGEELAMQAYRDAVNEPLPSPLKEVIVAQKQAVDAAHERIRTLRDTTPS